MERGDENREKTGDQFLEGHMEHGSPTIFRGMFTLLSQDLTKDKVYFSN